MLYGCTPGGLERTGYPRLQMDGVLSLAEIL